MKNFEVEDKNTGKKYWISRSMAIVGFIMTYDYEHNEPYFLLERRGPGCPDNVGKLCSVCGYLDYDETRLEALIRECKEELGIDISECEITEWEVIDDPKKDARQNLSTRYFVYTDGFEELKKYISYYNTDTESRGGEKDEVSELVLLSVSEIERMKSEDFAFNHREIILELVNLVFNNDEEVTE